MTGSYRQGDSGVLSWERSSASPQTPLGWHRGAFMAPSFFQRGWLSAAACYFYLDDDCVDGRGD